MDAGLNSFLGALSIYECQRFKKRLCTAVIFCNQTSFGVFADALHDQLHFAFVTMEKRGLVVSQAVCAGQWLIAAKQDEQAAD